MTFLRPAALRFALLVAIASSSSACATVRFTPDATTHFTARETGGARHYVYLPAAWKKDDASTTWPVIVYLHGGGETGTDGLAPTQKGMGPVAYRSNGALPFIVIFPQVPPKGFWALPDQEAALFAAIQDVLDELHGDPTRVYLTGNSMGGYGTWLIAQRNPGKFAALAPICGGVRPPKGRKLPPGVTASADPEGDAARAIGKTPVWAFHGASDWIVNPKVTRDLVAALKANGGDVQHTEFPGVGHNAEDSAYVLPGFFEWLGKQKLEQPADFRPKK